MISKRELDARIQGESKRISLAFLSAGSAGFTPSWAAKAAGAGNLDPAFSSPVILLVVSQVGLARGLEPLGLGCFLIVRELKMGMKGQEKKGGP